MNWKPVFALILLGVTIITYLGARFVSYYSNRRKFFIILLSIISLTPLLLYKYYNFLNDSISVFLSYIGLHFTMPGLNWAIPVGISFFTFQALGYMLDVYFKRCDVEKSFTDYVLFVSFFPQVMSGPISKASELLPQIKNPQPFNYSQGVAGLKMLLWGMFMKVVVADRLGLYVDAVYGNYIHYTGANCFMASVFYSFQIYADFAGYSFMAMGIAKLLGYNIINNFRRPYFSLSVTDFWRRWHISLSRWLKDYVYIPLGGSRCSRIRNYWNIFVTFLVSGIWHGANWTFVLWGVIHGVSQIIEKSFGFNRISSPSKIYQIERIVLTFLVVNIAWIFFRMPSIELACDFIVRIFTEFNVGEVLHREQTSIAIGLPILLFKDLRDEFFKKKFRFLDNKYVRRIIYIFLFSLIISLGVLDSGQFIYVNF